MFVSSTIYDFRDLRSALKYWLEELGYDVQMSDYAEFDKDADENSYHACLKTIDTCDYFVLLVGGRVGGLYNKPDRISITRMEYRHAYERLKASKLTVIPLVRHDLWDIREDRAALQTFLRGDFAKTRELTDADVDAIATHPSKFATDAEAIFSFIDEVARVDEMRAAVSLGSGHPKGNWVHAFDGFEDVAAALKVALGSSNNLRRRTLEASLRHEVVRNLRGRLGSKPNQLEDEVGALRLRNEIGVLTDLAGNTSLATVEINSFGLGLSFLAPDTIETTFLDEALRSGEFLTYDSVEDRFRVGPEQECLLVLRTAINRLRLMPINDLRQQFINEYMAPAKGRVRFTVQNIVLVQVLLAYETYERMIRAMISTYRMLNGAPPQVQTEALPASLARLPLKAVSTLQDVERWIDASDDWT
ncbi:MAG: DUF4062 domain-containing protein [Polyangiales bacterium]